MIEDVHMSKSYRKIPNLEQLSFILACIHYMPQSLPYTGIAER